MKLAICLLIVAYLAHVEGQSSRFNNFYLRFFCQQASSSYARSLCQFYTTTRAPPITRSTTTPRPTTRRPITRRPIPTSTARTTRTNARPSAICERPSRRCTEGKLLGDLFSVNFIAPSADGPTTPSSSRGGSSVFPSGGRSGSTSGRTTGTTSRGQTNNVGGRTGTLVSNIFGGRAPTGQIRPSVSGVNSSNPGQGGASTNGGSRTSGRGGGRSLPTGTSNSTAQPCKQRFITDSRGRIIAGSCIPTNKTSNRSSRRSKRQNYVPVQTKRDLLIMMDESGSVGYARFDKVKRIAAAIVRLLCREIQVHPSLTRVAVTSFDSVVHYHVRLRSPSHQAYLDYDGNALANYIYNQVRYDSRTQGYTCLIDALEHAYNVALNSRHGGRRGQGNVEQDIIIISDGCENCVTPEYHAHDRIRQITAFFIAENIHVYVIGIGIRERCKQTLNLLAQGGRCFHFFYLTNWDYIVDDFLLQLEHPPSGICLNTFEAAEGQCLSNFG